MERGVITSNFGRQPHPVLPGITIENNGVDITTEKGAPCGPCSAAPSPARRDPRRRQGRGAGPWRLPPVYSNLRDARVAKGDKVETKQPIGTVMTEDNSSKAHVSRSGRSPAAASRRWTRRCGCSGSRAGSVHPTFAPEAHPCRTSLTIFLGTIGPWRSWPIVLVLLLLLRGKKIPELMRGLGQA